MQRINIRHLFLGLGLATVAGVGWVLLSGPGASQAASQDLGGICVLEPCCTSVDLDEDTPGHWSLVVGLRWTCPPSHPGVASAVGMLRLTSRADASVSVEMPCRLDVPVTADANVLATASTEWDESDAGHRWLRGQSPADVSVTFTADWFRSVRSAGSMSGGVLPEKAHGTSGPGSHLQAGRGFRRVDARTGLTR